MNHLIIPADTLYCIGDIHGEYGPLTAWFRRCNLLNACIIFCGDIALGFNSEVYYQQTFLKINRECKKRNVTLIFLRGNHDDPTFFSEQKIQLSHIISIPDYTIVSTAEHCVLCVGGAISIDRTYHKMLAMAMKCARFHGCSLTEAKQKSQHLYWEAEPPAYNELALNEIHNSGLHIDIVCTHTCPSFCEPLSKDGLERWLSEDPDLEKDVDNERKTMDAIYERLLADGHPLRTWCYGHFHYHYVTEHNGITFRMLDMCQHSSIYDMIEIKK